MPTPRVTRTRVIAAVEVALIAPATLFMFALFMRNVQPLEYETARTAAGLVAWYAGRIWTLWILLMAFPLIAFVSGVRMLHTSWSRDAELQAALRVLLSIARRYGDALLVAGTTLVAAGVLGIVALHALNS